MEPGGLWWTNVLNSALPPQRHRSDIRLEHQDPVSHMAGALEDGREVWAVGPWCRVSTAESAPTPVRVPFISRRWLLAAPAASADNASLVWWRPRSVVSVLGVQQSDSVIYICIYTYMFFFRFSSIIGYYNILNVVPCAIQ